MREFVSQQSNITSFTSSLSKSSKFKADIVQEVAKLLEFRLQSASLFFLCLELLENGPNDYLCSGKKSRDPFLLKIIKGSSSLKNKPVFDHSPNLIQLKDKLLETEILPLSEFESKRIQSFWDDVKQRSNPVLLHEIDLTGFYYVF